MIPVCCVSSEGCNGGHRILKVLPKRYTHVVEFRDPSWLIEPVFALLEWYKVAHCIHDMRPLQVPLRVTAKTVYICLHGANV